MIFVALLVVFIAGLACGLALRPAFDRRRQLRRAYTMARQRRGKTSAPIMVETDPLFVPRDYYLADRRQRGTLAESFGLQRRAEDHPDDAASGLVEPDPDNLAMPRDYYDRVTPDDEGTLAEGYGLRGQQPGKSAR